MELIQYEGITSHVNLAVEIWSPLGQDDSGRPSRIKGVSWSHIAGSSRLITVLPRPQKHYSLLRRQARLQICSS